MAIQEPQAKELLAHFTHEHALAGSAEREGRSSETLVHSGPMEGMARRSDRTHVAGLAVGGPYNVSSSDGQPMDPYN